MPSAFIPDGYTRETTIPKTEEYDAVKIVYRPMLWAEQKRLLFGPLRASEAGDNQAMQFWEKEVAASLAKHLVSWDVADASGKPVKATAENVGRIVPACFEAIYNAIAGYSKEDDKGDSEDSADAKN